MSENFERVWRERMEGFAPEAREDDWARMQTVLRTATPTDRRRANSWMWWLPCLVLVCAVAWTAYFREARPAVTGFPIDIRQEPGIATGPSTGAHEEAQPSGMPQNIRTKAIAPLQLPSFRLRSGEGADGPLVLIRRSQRPFPLLPATAPHRLPTTDLDRYFRGMPPVEVTPASRSFYPPALNTKKH